MAERSWGQPPDWATPQCICGHSLPEYLDFCPNCREELPWKAVNHNLSHDNERASLYEDSKSLDTSDYEFVSNSPNSDERSRNNTEAGTENGSISNEDPKPNDDQNNAAPTFDAVKIPEEANPTGGFSHMETDNEEHPVQNKSLFGGQKQTYADAVSNSVDYRDGHNMVTRSKESNNRTETNSETSPTMTMNYLNDEPSIPYTFAILLPPDLIKSLRNTDWKLLVGTNACQHGLFEDSKLIMAFKQRLKDGFELYALRVEFKGYHFPLEYKYFIRTCDGNEWEYFHCSHLKERDNRIIHKAPVDPIQFGGYFEREKPTFEFALRPEFFGGKSKQEKIWSRLQKFHSHAIRFFLPKYRYHDKHRVLFSELRHNLGLNPVVQPAEALQSALSYHDALSALHSCFNGMVRNGLSESIDTQHYSTGTRQLSVTMEILFLASRNDGPIPRHKKITSLFNLLWTDNLDSESFRNLKNPIMAMEKALASDGQNIRLGSTLAKWAESLLENGGAEHEGEYSRRRKYGSIIKAMPMINLMWECNGRIGSDPAEGRFWSMRPDIQMKNLSIGDLNHLISGCRYGSFRKIGDFEPLFWRSFLHMTATTCNHIINTDLVYSVDPVLLLLWMVRHLNLNRGESFVTSVEHFEVLTDKLGTRLKNSTLVDFCEPLSAVLKCLKRLNRSNSTESQKQWHSLSKSWLFVSNVAFLTDLALQNIKENDKAASLEADLRHVIRYWLCHQTSSNVSDTKAWFQILTRQSFKTELVTASWNEVFLEEFKLRIHHLEFETVVEELNSLEMELREEILVVIKEYIIQNIHAKQNKKALLRRKISNNLKGIMNAICKGTWPQNFEGISSISDPKQHEALLFCCEIDQKEGLDQDMKSNLKEAATKTVDQIQEIKNGSASIQRMKMVAENQHQIRNFLSGTAYSGCGEIFQWIESIKDANKRFEDEMEQLNLLRSFTDFKFLSGNEEYGQRISRLYEQQDQISIDSVFDRPEMGIYRLKNFGITSEIAEILKKLCSLKGNCIFSHFWSIQFNEFFDSGPSLVFEALIEIYECVTEKLKPVVITLLDGTITLIELESLTEKLTVDYLETHFITDLEQLAEHYKVKITSTHKTLESRKKQFSKYLELKQNAGSIEIMMTFLTHVQATEAHTELMEIQKLVSGTLEKSPEIGSVSEKDDFVSDATCHLDQRQLDTITTYMKCEALVDWVRKTIKFGELDSFVDMASTNVGESGEQIAMVTDFGTAVSAFAPLIYELNDGPNDKTLHEIMELLGQVWYSLGQNISKKLEESCLNLTRIQNLKEATFSVETTSLHTVQSINRTALFRIGFFEKAANKRNDLDIETLFELEYEIIPADVIKKAEQRTLDGTSLVASPTDSEPNLSRFERKNLQLRDLTDLHSRLMLIGGRLDQKGTIGKEIEKFSQIYFAVRRLLKLLLEHQKTGNIFFSQWQCTFYCYSSQFSGWNSGKQNRLRLHTSGDQFEFPKDEESDPLSNTQQDIDLLCNFLEKAQTEWNRHVEEKRAKHPFLNYFTNRQIVHLRKSLAELGKDETFDMETKMLLMKLNEQVSQKMIMDALSTYEDSVTNYTLADSESTDMSPEEIKQKKAIEYLIGNYISPELAYRAVAEMEANDIDDLDEIYCWALEHPEAVTDPEADAPSLAESLAKIQALDTESSIPVSERLYSVWTRHLKEESIGGFQEFIGIEQLGIALQEIGKASPHLCISDENLSHPIWITPNKPNLMVVKKSDVLRFCLTLYADDLSRIHASRVLVCHEHTSTEEITLFIERIKNAQHSATYSVLFIEKLNSKLSLWVETLLENLLGHKTKPFGLALFCSEEDFDGCHLAGILAKHRQNKPEPMSVNECRKLVNGWVALTSPNYATSTETEDLADKFSAFLTTSVGYGHGKSLAIRRQRLSTSHESVKIPIHDLHVNHDELLVSFLQRRRSSKRLFHLDFIDHRTRGVDEFLFEIIVLKSFSSASGRVWHQLPGDQFAIEITSVASPFLSLTKDGDTRPPTTSLPFKYCLPVIQCHSPYQSLTIGRGIASTNPEIFHRLIDQDFCSDEAKICFQYLTNITGNQAIPDNFTFDPEARADPLEVLQKLCQQCGIPNPSWTELEHFKNFLALQLEACERSLFCSAGIIQGLKNFSVNFMTKMTEDFSTRSMSISEHAVSLNAGDETLLNIQALAEKRGWENKPHPYLFFNADMESISFFGCVFQSSGRCYRLVAEGTNDEIMTVQSGLFHLLEENISKIDKCQIDEFKRPFDRKTRGEKLYKIYRVLLKEANQFLPNTPAELITLPDPDQNYELTLDCTLKMLAIEMRFRCKIPVIIMGETGCGKTKLIEFLCGLKKMGVVQTQGVLATQIQNLLILKVHGGVTSAIIEEKVEEAMKLAIANQKKLGLETILFFDEANTTSSISLIKELMIDGTLNGREIFTGTRKNVPLRFIAAVNPYKRHEKSAIQKANNAGLQHHFEDLEAISNRGYEGNKFFSSRTDSSPIPIRELVYRVHPLPPSMIPLVWDFGTLTTNVENVYIRQMVARFENSSVVGQSGYFDAEDISQVLQNMQHFMKTLESEASFVSLRDVQRTLYVMEWFFSQRNEGSTQLHQILDHRLRDKTHVDPEESHLLRSFVLALCICYRTSLQCKKIRVKFDAELSSSIANQGHGDIDVANQISCCQDIFLEELDLEPEIAKNEALKENVFMMVICCQLRIPLFLVGKPGSSKSLAKTLVSKAMRGRSSKGPIFKALTQAHVVSFQCSLLADADGIQSVFRTCAMAQKDKRRKDFTALALFDEIGLAEYSPLMPLKALHSLLEDGVELEEEETSAEESAEDDSLNDYHRSAFLGISNWTLDPAKMNRGICVSRISPDQEQLEETARSICHWKEAGSQFDRVKDLIPPLTIAYLELYESQSDYEFYGLRDFYSMIKMLYSIVSQPSDVKGPRDPSYREIMKIVHHNFGGQRDYDNGSVNIFAEKIKPFFEGRTHRNFKPEILSLISDNLRKRNAGIRTPDSRYLLVLTENYAATRLLTKLPELDDAVIIFGSAFKSDLEYTQICNTINTIRLCMDTGRTVVLLNLETVYESLYDLLNQAFTWFGDKRFVEIGLGSCRVKSHVDEKFRLIIIAEEEDVRQKFPAALINRMEKHFVDMETDMSDKCLDDVDKLEDWVAKVAKLERNKAMSTSREKKCFVPTETFIGYNRDTAAAVVSDLAQESNDSSSVLDEAKIRMMFTATPEGILRVKNSTASEEYEWCYDQYFNKQAHQDLPSFLQWWMNEPKLGRTVQISTHAAQMLATEDQETLEKFSCLEKFKVHILTLQDFFTEHQFEAAMRENLKDTEKPHLVILQCLAAERDPKLVACIRHKIEELLKDKTIDGRSVWIAFTLFFNRVASHLGDFVKRWLNDGSANVQQLSTPYRIVTDSDKQQLAKLSGMEPYDVHILPDRNELDNILRKAKARADETCQIVVATCETSNQNAKFGGYRPAKSAGELKSEFMKVSQSLQPKNAGNLRLLILSTSPKISSFPGAAWISFHLDELTTQRGDIQDVKALQGKSLQELMMDKNTIDWDALIEKILPEVATIIAGDAGKRLSRITMIMKNCERLRRLVWEKLIDLMTEKSNRAGGMEQLWLEEEATNRKSILDNKTFRNSLKRKIEHSIAHLLAGLVCFIDDSGNLELLQSHEEDSEILNRLWIHIFESKECIEDLKYNSPLFVTESADGIPEINITFNSRQSISMSVFFPFSWKLINEIDAMLDRMKLSEDISTTKISGFRDTFFDTPWGVIVRDHMEHSVMERKALFPRYLRDFVLLKTKISDATICELIQDWIAVFVERVQQIAKGAFPSVVAAHVAYRLLEPHICSLLDLLSVWPELKDLVTSDIFKQLLQKSDFQADICAAELCFANVKQAIHPNENFDLRKTVECLKSVEPGLQLNDTEFARKRENRKEWLYFYELAAPAMQSVFDEPKLSLPFMSELEPLINQLGTRRFNLLKRKDCSVKLSRAMNDAENSLKTRWDYMSQAALFLKHNLTVSFQFKLAPLMQLLDKGLPMESFLQELKKKFRLLWGHISFTFYFHKGKPTCSLCGRNAGKPNLLQCLHVLHDDCLQEIRQSEAVCPEKNCRTPITEDFVAGALQKLERKKEQYHSCRVSMRNFFLDFIASSVFCKCVPPSIQVFEEILKIISPEENITSGLSPFPDEDALDKSPVLRSFVLQRLLQYEYEKVCDLLELFFMNSMTFTTTQEQKAQFLWMAIQCFEDMLSHTLAVKTTSEKLNLLKKYIIHQDEGSEVLKCRSIAATRLWMVHFSDSAMHHIAENTSTGFDFNEHIDFGKRLIETMQADHGDNAAFFPIKHLFRKHGAAALRSVTENQSLSWLAGGSQTEDHEDSPDLYSLFGPAYTDARQKFLSNQIEEEDNPVFAALSAYELRSDETVDEAMNHAAQNHVQNLWTPGKAIRLWNASYDALSEPFHQIALDVQKLGTATAVVFEKFQQDELFHIFWAILSSPDRLKGSFIPAMPEDHTLEDYNAIRSIDANSTINKCPRGHLYVIGDCGKPYYHGQCHCGARIGGQGHNYEPGNSAADTNALGNTRGYCSVLQEAGVLKTGERGLSRLETAIVKTLLDVTMLQSCSLHLPEIAGLVNDDKITDDDVVEFLNDHVEADIAALCEITSENRNDCLALIYFILETRLSASDNGLLRSNDPFLRNLESRRIWELRFATFLKPTLESIPQALNSIRETLSSDPRVNGALWKKIFDTDEESEDHLFWRYRTPHTLSTLKNHCLNQIDGQDPSSKSELILLKIFLQDADQLSMVQYLRDITKLQERLYDIFCGHVPMTRKNAGETTIENFIDEQIPENNRTEMRRLVYVFFTVLSKAQGDLEKASFHLGKDQRPVIVEIPNDLHWGSPLRNRLSIILPVSIWPESVPGIALSIYLAELQSNFVTQMRKLLYSDRDRIPVTPLLKLNSEQLIRFDLQSDLYPLLLLHRNFELAVNQAQMTTNFDLASLQRHIASTLIKRPFMIDPKMPPVLKTQEEVFLDSFELVKQNIPQREISLFQRKELFDSCEGQLHLIKRCLEFTERVIRFSSSSGLTNEELPIDDPGSNIPNLSSCPKQLTKGFLLNQVLAIWSTLKCEEKLLNYQANLELFPELPGQFEGQRLDGTKLEGVRKTMETLDANQFLIKLTETLVLYVPRDCRSTTEEGMEDHLSYSLKHYMMRCDRESEIEASLESFPLEIQLKEAVGVWKAGAEFIKRY